jgi:hypothetical protein
VRAWALIAVSLVLGAQQGPAAGCALSCAPQVAAPTSPGDGDELGEDETSPADDDASAQDDDSAGPGHDDSTPCGADYDGDGWCAPEDCDIVDASVYPGAPELCDGLDNDCDGVVPAAEFDADSDGFWPCQGDCNDGDGTVLPGAPELCDGLDNDCDGVVPEDELDQDADGLPPCAGDCDDFDASIAPGAPESCDLVDSDCDGDLVDGESDVDGDGVPDCSDPDADGDGVTAAAGDCDDLDANAFPGQTSWFGTERASGGYDYDCDGAEVTQYNANSSFPSMVICGSWQGPTTGWWCSGGAPSPDNPWCPSIPPCGGVAAFFPDQSDIYGCPVSGTTLYLAQPCR